MAFQVSPGVQIREISLAAVIPAVSTTEAAIAGEFKWGPVEDRVLITSEDNLYDRFLSPDNNVANKWFCAADILSYGNQLYTVRAASSTANNASSGGTGFQVKNDDHYENNYADGSLNVGDWIAKYPGAVGNSLKTSTCPSSNAYESTLTGNVSVTANSTAVTGVGTLFQTELVVGDRLILNGEDKVVKTITSNTALTLQTAHATGAAANTSVKRRWEYYDSFDVAPGTSSYVSTRGGTGDELHIVVVDEDGEFSGTANTILEKFEKVSFASDAKKPNGSTNFYKNVINQQSEYIRWADHNTSNGNAGANAESTTFGGQGLPQTNSFAGGTRGTAPADSDLIRAYNLFKDSQDVDISFISAADASQTLALHLINNIAEVRKDCLVAISPLRANVVDNAGSEADDIVTFRNLLPSTSYAVMDSGWKYRYDRYNDVFRYVPLNGDVIGTMIQTDLQRDPWYSPGGLTRGQIKNVVKLAYNPASKAERDVLYRAGVNPVVTFPGQGTVLWGDKTLLATPDAFDRINVRRLFIVLEKAIATAARAMLFEFNDEFTRAQFRNLVEPFLRDIQGRRGITRFRVVADETNNTPDVIARNEFVGSIFVVPNYSINYITLNFVAVRGDVEFEEIVGSV